MQLIACNSNRPLALAVGDFLGIPLTATRISQFPDGETFVEILESVDGEDVVVLQSTNHPANDHVMELLLILEILKRNAARSITACIPYFGYGRQDRPSSPLASHAAKLVTDLLITAGAQRILTLDLHTPHLNISVDSVCATSLFHTDILARGPQGNLLVVSPDLGGIARARSLATHLSCGLAVIEKQRGSTGTVRGEVIGHHCILVDDLLDSGETLCTAAEALMQKGALSVRGYVTHGVFSGSALQRIEASFLQEVVVTDSVYLLKSHPKIRMLSIAPLLGEAIQGVRQKRSVSAYLKISRYSCTQYCQGKFLQCPARPNKL